MAIASGRLVRFLQGAGGKIDGMLLESGHEIRFPVVFADVVSALFNAGSPVQVDVTNRADARQYSRTIKITNLDSRESLTLPAPKQAGKPGMQLKTTPSETASLAPDSKSEIQSGPASAVDCDPLNLARDRIDSCPSHPASFFHNLLSDHHSKGTDLLQRDSAQSIGSAYDFLHRIQAILAYLHIMKHRVPGISQFLDEAKHTYEQALARFDKHDFVGAKEVAEASISLSRVVEIVMARTLRSDNSLPSLVPPPPTYLSFSTEPEHVEENLAETETVLSRIHWILQNGTLPSEDRAQVRKIASWGDAFYKQAQHTYRDSGWEDAAEFAQAALAGAYSAEHVCRKWYVNHSMHP